MKAIYELSVETRQQYGKRASRRLRRLTKQVPGALYGAGKDTVSIQLSHNELWKALENEGFYSHILTLKLNGVEEKAVLKDLQRHPCKPAILHVDFLRINPKEKLTMHVPLHFKGGDQAPGLKQGGQISHLVNDVEIRCLPADLPEFIEVDLSHLELEQTVHLSELTPPPGVELVGLLHEQDPAVASLHLPHIIAEPSEAEAAEAASEEEGTSSAEGESEPAKE